MGFWLKPGYEDAIMMGRLQRLAEGFDSDGNPVSRKIQLRAIEKWQEIQRNKQLTANDTTRAEGDYLRAENDRMRAENDRLRAAAETEVLRRRAGIEEQRLQLEAVETVERLQIEKARVVVEALEVAARGGVEPDHLLSAIQDLSQALQQRPEPELKQLEARGQGRGQGRERKALPGPVKSLEGLEAEEELVPPHPQDNSPEARRIRREIRRREKAAKRRGR